MLNIPNNNYHSQVAAVLVSYHPNVEVLDAAVRAVLNQVENVFIVDNGTENFSSSWFAELHKVQLLPQQENLGISAAQNIGIRAAKNAGAEFVLLLDQDSIPAPDMVEKLLAAIRQKSSEGYKVAADGPRYVDERNTERPPFSRLLGMRLIREKCTDDNAIVLTDFVISSGSLISVDTLDKVGGMDEDLFIDQVDIEWGLRAKALGYQSFGVCNAKMHHALGEEPLVLFGLKLLNHSPLRHYYIFRNAVWLMFKPYTPAGWRFYLARMILLRYVLYPLWVAPRLSYLKMMSLALWHGLTGRMGKL